MKERYAEKERVLEERIKTAQQKFQEYKAVAVKKAIEECEAKHKLKEETYQKRIAELETEIASLKVEIEQLKSKIAELESRPATATVETGIKQEDMDAALAAKDAEHQAAIATLQAVKPEPDFEEAKETLRMEIQAEILAIQQNIDGAELTPEAAAARDKEKEKLKAIISRNVEHRLNKEKEKWKSEVEARRETLIEEKVQAVLKDKVAELETKMQEREATLKAEMEKSKDAIRQEGVMRSKVQINMLERKNKQLEAQLKASQGGDQVAAATTTASAPPTPAPQPSSQLTTGLRRPSSVTGSISQPSQQTAPAAQKPQDLQAAQQAAIAAAEQAIAAGPQGPPQGQRRGENQGTGPGALRQLRGALGASGIPRGGAIATRGRGAPPSQAGSPTQPQQSNPFTAQIPALASGIPNPFATGGQPQQPQQGRGGGIPRGRGLFAGRGRAQQGHQQGQQPGQPTAGSPPRGGGQLNPGARQFVPPGSKRTREGEDDSGSEGKRARSSMDHKSLCSLEVDT
ncbi:hypothetical protein FN846DRAFT_954576 [Sphaerosporella brunnea]|uniref:Uncharacterized protein n=1 Tax=Sphaerosporella brunnea TaxID=1250544 RepID=A0A5J5EU17_9PEZI|nr:hypothetical protein FN846DRAFT_954576 [Sphaerosporella brunnea]